MTEHLITLTTHDAQTLCFRCDEDEDLISAAERQRIILPQQCRSGVCGFCTATHVSGAYILKDYNTAALSDDQRQSHHTLLCRTYPRADLNIRGNYDYAVIKFGQIPQAVCSVVSAKLVNTHVLHLVLQQPPSATELLSVNLVAGQYVQLLTMDKSIQRAYSPANPANWDGKLEFYIQLREQGKFSQVLRQISSGANLLVQGAQGDFTLKEHGLKPRYFIAGGTGLSPILAMLRHMTEFAEPHPARIFFGARHESDLFAQDVIAHLSHALTNFSYQYCLSRPSSTWNGYHGSVLKAVTEALTLLKAPPDIYICGSTRLIDGVLELTNQLGIASTNVFYEKFG